MFQNFMLSVILLNTMVLSMDHLEIDPVWQYCIELSDIVFGGVYVAEFCFKYAAYGNSYFASYKNLFDFLVVICVLVGFMTFDASIIMNGTANSVLQALEGRLRSCMYFKCFQFLFQLLFFVRIHL